MSNIVFINGSPKINEPSASEHLLKMVGNHFEEAKFNKICINVQQSIRKHKTEDDFVAISKADVLVIVFPLYVFCMPGLLTRFLEDYYNFYIENGMTSSNPKVYAVVNCGFPEPGINLEAVRVIRSFCHHVNANFRFGILIGGGPMLLDARNASFMKKTIQKLNSAFLTIVNDATSDELKDIGNIEIPLSFPRRLYLFMGNRSWVALARKNGINKKDIYKRPYR